MYCAYSAPTARLPSTARARIWTATTTISTVAGRPIPVGTKTGVPAVAMAQVRM